MLTVGVEEEFLLLEPDGAVAPVAAEVVRQADAGSAGNSGSASGPFGRVTAEYMAYQLETTTGVCTRLDELRSDLVRLRRTAAQAAERAGARLVAAGSPPFRAGPLHSLTDDVRYRELARRFPDATAASGACACHVHVGIPDRDLAVEVLARLRPWLPTLLALTVNSPFVGGVDSGWSSTRYRRQLRWPTFRPPQMWADAGRYDHAVRALIDRGAAMDPASVYFLARLSARYPTLEVRVADACLTAEDALVFAGVIRALVASLIDDARRGDRVTRAPATHVRAGLLAAAQHGMSTRHRAVPGRPGTAATALVTRLLAKITPALDAAGDADDVRGGLDRLCRIGTGAERQRNLWIRTAAPGATQAPAFVASLADATVPVTSWC